MSVLPTRCQFRSERNAHTITAYARGQNARISYVHYFIDNAKIGQKIEICKFFEGKMRAAHKMR